MASAVVSLQDWPFSQVSLGSSGLKARRLHRMLGIESYVVMKKMGEPMLIAAPTNTVPGIKLLGIEELAEIVHAQHISASAIPLRTLSTDSYCLLDDMDLLKLFDLLRIKYLLVRNLGSTYAVMIGPGFEMIVNAFYRLERGRKAEAAQLLDCPSVLESIEHPLPAFVEFPGTYAENPGEYVQEFARICGRRYVVNPTDAKYVLALI